MTKMVFRGLAAVTAVALLCLVAAVGCKTASRSGQALYELNLRGNPEGAWRMAKKSADEHALPGDEQSCEAHSVALHVLAENAGLGLEPPDADAQADRLLAFVRAGCGSSRYLMTAEGHMARYLHHTGRPGLALPHAERCLELAEQAGPVDQAGAHLLSAEIFDEMGFTEPRDLHINEAMLVLGRHLAKVDRSRDTAQTASDLKLFQSMVLRRLDYLSREPQSADRDANMATFMDEAEAMDKVVTDYGDRPRLYARGIVLFCRAGNPAKAGELYAALAKVADKDLYRDTLDLSQAQVLAAQGRAAEAADLFAATLKRMKDQGRAPDFDTAFAASLAYLQAGRPAEADALLAELVELMESRRGSFAVTRRGRYLSDMKIRVYWALLEARARLYLDNPDDRRFDAAMRAAMMLKARQFGDFLGIAPARAGGRNVSALLAPDEALVVYAATRDDLIVFTFTRDARRVRILDVPGPELAAMAENLRRTVADSAPAVRVDRASAELGRAVLGALGREVLAAERLTVIPDGPLNAVPFAMLRPAPGAEPLIQGRAVAYAPSLSFLLEAPFSPARAGDNEFLVLADPDYGEVGPPDTFATRAVAVSAKKQSLFAALPETRQEAEAIRSLAGKDSTTVLYGRDATKTRLKDMDLAAYTNLHFATHGVLGGMVPGVYEPALVLTADKASGDDGFLRLSEIQELKLAGRLVVLSACDTGRGEYYAGEGVLGLSRGFLLAGGQAVLVSLWPVVSSSTVTLMRVFYEGLMAGQSPEQSLRKAQLALMADPATTAPLYWAPFVLIGR